MSLNQFALKVSLTVCKPQLTAKDEKATTDAEAANNASGAGQYRKDLYPKHLIAPIQEVESAARAFIARQTLEGVLPSSKFMWFADLIAPYEVQFNQAVTVFMQNITNVMTEAQKTQGDMFDASLYPDTAALRARFSWNVSYDTVADNSKFAQLMAPMDAASQARLSEAITKQVTTQQESLVSAAVSRLKDVVAHMAVATARGDRAVVNKKTGGIDVRPPIFRASLVDNITEITDLLQGYAAALPVEVVDLMDKAKALTTANSETLKNDPDKRKAAQTNATALLSEINDLMGYSAPSITVTTLPEPAAQCDEAVPPPSVEDTAPAGSQDELLKLAQVFAPANDFDAPWECVQAIEAHDTVPHVAVPVAASRPAPKEYDLGGLFDVLDDMENF
jgi:hypothetical protein